MPTINITISQQDGSSSSANAYTEDPEEVQKALDVLEVLTSKASSVPQPAEGEGQ